MRIESSTSEYECRCASGERIERRTVPPEMTTPAQTIESIAWPRRPSSSKTNFAGCVIPGHVWIGQSWLYMLKIGWTEIRSMCAS